MAAILHWTQIFLAQHLLLSPLIFIFAHVLFAVFILPCSPMAVIAGVLWGKWVGLLISIFAAVLSSCTTFWLSRRFLRDRMYRFLSKRYSKTDWFLAQTQKHGWKFVATVQLNPIAPGSTLGYLFGLTGMKFSVYVFFLVLFMLPLQILLVICGDSFSRIMAGSLSWIFVGMPLFFVLAYFIYGFLFKRIKKVNVHHYVDDLNNE